MEIRRMLRSDEADVGRLYVQSWQAGYKGLLPQDYLDGLESWRWDSKFTEMPGSFVITDGGKIVGHSCARESADEEMSGWGEVWTLYVLPEYWGKGFGKALLRHTVDWLREQGFERIYLWALETNSRARRFYESQGFCENGDTLCCDIGGATVTDIRYINVTAKS
ncbi:MAG: GNAT family N-acetyltransferase [Oscillospiraceae bacterium]